MRIKNQIFFHKKLLLPFSWLLKKLLDKCNQVAIMKESFKKRMTIKNTSPLRRNTKIRSALLDIFAKGGVFSVPELLELLEGQNIKANKTTLYRQLEKLSEEKYIEHTSIVPGVMHYEKAETLGHHHHLICEQCKKIEHIHNDHLEFSIKQMENSLKRDFHFSFLSHSLSFSGLCKTCTA